MQAPEKGNLGMCRAFGNAYVCTDVKRQRAITLELVTPRKIAGRGQNVKTAIAGAGTGVFLPAICGCSVQRPACRSSKPKVRVQIPLSTPTDLAKYYYLTRYISASA